MRSSDEQNPAGYPEQVRTGVARTVQGSGGAAVPGLSDPVVHAAAVASAAEVIEITLDVFCGALR
ncbi:hypothetical protein FHR32_006538 [Streptosporangium album]|uniref:Uncharacterized protein n=1 Tax=Streptosporangium album TaxID=47479 RepID=A0A7W7S1T4_9ACTN|nr:hypothetical protein [Streptosporangium album]MBB4942152.1 hypothetical protein [Streptosporangium album]